MFTFVTTIIGAFIIFGLGTFFGTKYKGITDSIHTLQHKDESAPPEIIRTNPQTYREITADTSLGGSLVIKTKTPQELEKEDEEKANRLAGL